MKKAIFLSALCLMFGVDAFGQHSSKTVDEGVTINGVRWATRNVDAPGTFAASPDTPGMVYQWGRKKSWPATGEVTGWDTSSIRGWRWEKAGDPCPAGWRLPTVGEIENLLDDEKVRNEWTAPKDNTAGRTLTDKTTGNRIFLPAAGIRKMEDGQLDMPGAYAIYWSSEADSSVAIAFSLVFSRGATGLPIGNFRRIGGSIRCVAE
jgi:uncharacterized protein (TIGR02145 family)